uniref:Insulin-like peptide 5 n=1 Tax=Gnatocerus cornutus TaxID=1553328 RepID=A0A7G1GD38_9CUCU|nr:insulin-like peptide 5 [Gnatocerus cornutus]
MNKVVLLLCVVTAIYASPQDVVNYLKGDFSRQCSFCRGALHDAMRAACDGYYNTVNKKSVIDLFDEEFTFFEKKSVEKLVDDCCWKPCNYTVLRKYCF